MTSAPKQRKNLALLLGLIWLAVSLGNPLGVGRAADAVKGGNSPNDSLADSSKVRAFIPLAKRPAPKSSFISSLLQDGAGMWVVGDSGLIAHSNDDSLFTRISPPDSLPLHCAILWGSDLVCAGDSGRVFRVVNGRVRRSRLDDSRAVLDLSHHGDLGLLCGEAGLLARSLDGGQNWDTLRAPLPMRFSSALCLEDAWWTGGAGGRLYQSVDQGLHWDLLPNRFGKAVTDLQVGVDGALMVLDREGGVHRMENDAPQFLGRVAVGRARQLEWLAGGWLVAGEDGRVAWLDPVSGESHVARLPVRTVIGGMMPRGDHVVLAGAWSTLASWNPFDDKAPVLLNHTLAAAPIKEDLFETPLEAAAVILAATEIGDSTIVGGSRFFQNVLDTDTRVTTPPTRLTQLVRSYDRVRTLGMTGRAMVALDVSATGRLDSIQVLDEWPAGLGIGGQARKVAENLTFTPGFIKSGMVRSRLLFPLVFVGSEPEFLSWVKGDSDPGEELDSLLAMTPKPESPLAPKELVKKLGFPRKARRFIWEGQTAIEYFLDSAGVASDARVLWEPDSKYEFGKHGLDVLPDLKMRLPDELRLAAGDKLRVVQRLSFDRKQYKRAQRAVRDGFQFSEVLLAIAVTDSARYEPGLSQLEWLLNDFQAGGENRDWPELDLNLVMRYDGRLHDFKAEPVPGDTMREIDLEALRSLALLFTWGRPTANAKEDQDSLSLRWRPAAFKADSTNQPATLRLLLNGVVY